MTHCYPDLGHDPRLGAEAVAKPKLEQLYIRFVNGSN